ncbi:putative riboflavin import permease protein RfuC [Rubrobacter xylanophilus DSM 9941]|uniref:ABC transporter permease n=1 Tax=Rubrobacter xylanophilus TaxID=49319 RepID=UPI001C641AF3|nr:ABC transporter permease [Rubrobacter xylanophilus]QYJ16382.1 putative riboflavin import permease protein RfuC [Rubrobacter xylanophilus DSM 9941]
MSAGLRVLLGRAAGALVFPLVAIALALVVGAVIVLATGNNPLAAYRALIVGAVGSPAAIGRTLLNATPLIFTGLAVAVAFRAGLFNIGGEGQLYIGAITAAILGVSLGFLGPLAIPVVLFACFLTGFLWGAIPGLLKARFGAHEVITTIMLNFVAINLATYLALKPFRTEGLVPGTDFIEPAARIPALGLGRANYGLLIALLAAVAVYLLLWRTTLGFRLRAVGLSPGAANYAGMSIGTSTVLALAIGGAMAGLGGGVEVMGVYGKMSIPFVSNLGFNGIGVALLGRNHPAGVVLGALLFGGLASGAQELQFETDVPLDLADVLLAIILLLVTATRLVELIFGKRVREMASGTRLDEGLAS